MEVEKAFKRLLIKNPFYGLFCLNLPKEITRSVNTLSVSRNGVACQLNINPDFWEKYTDDEQLALLQHELGHICLKHMFMCESFSDQMVFNVAADCEINSYIDNLPKDGCNATKISKAFNAFIEEGLGTKAYYEFILKQMEKQEQQAAAKKPQKPCNGGQGGSSEDSSKESPQSSSSPSKAPKSQNQKDGSEEEQSRQQQRGEEEEQQYPKGFNPIDDHSKWKEFRNLPEATQQLIANNIDVALKNTAEQIEKQRGTIPAEFKELIEKLRTKKPEVFNWKAYFRRLLGSIYDVNIKSTRRRESKRFVSASGIQHKKKVSILVAVDTSGSVSKKELEEFFSEIDYVYKAGARITIVQCDSRIADVIEYDGKNIPEIKGRGGTDFNPPVEYYVKHKKEYASLIYFTDGEAALPKKSPSGIVWVISSLGLHQDYPGKAIYIPKE